MKLLKTTATIVLLIVCFPGTALAQVKPSEVEIIRDQYGVPHIYSPTDAGVAYGLAWANAEDDFQNIQLTLLAAKKMLGLHLGKEGAKVDYVVALLKCQEIARENINTLSTDYRAVLNGYKDGINSYAKNHRKEVFVPASFPVTEEEVLSAYVLSLAVMSGADKVIGDLFQDRLPGDPGAGTGSNAFAFSRELTDDGYVYLNINSHQPLEGPTAWYEAHLISEEGWNVLGGLFPGAATVFLGTNEHLGWAHTVNYPDKIDVYELEIHPEDELKYKFDNEWKKLELQEVKLRVKILFGLKISVKKEAYWSIYGPVVKNKRGTYAFDLGALHDVRAPEQWYRMNKATNWEEFRSALEMVAIPGFNVVYADKESNLFYLGNAKLPLRDSTYDWTGVVPGNTSWTLHQGYHSLQDLPQVFNPSSGYIFNVNNSAFNCTDSLSNPNPKDYDPTMGYKPLKNNRSNRFEELMERHDGKISWNDFLKIKYDDTLPAKLAYPVNMDIFFKLDTLERPKYNGLVRILQKWDRSSHYSNLGAAHFMIIYDYLVRTYRSEYTGEQFQLTTEQAWDAIAFTHDYLLKYFKKLDVHLGDYQLLVRGDLEVPVHGIRDVITSMSSKPYRFGRVKAHQGESLIMLVRYPEEGLPIIETINVYGASNRPDSPHYTDQMLMFVNQERKSMTLDLNQVRKNAEATYHPK